MQILDTAQAIILDVAQKSALQSSLYEGSQIMT